VGAANARPGEALREADEGRMMKRFLLALMIPMLSGCTTLDSTLGEGLVRAESASATLTNRSIDWLCNRMSRRQLRETINGEARIAWALNALCRPISIPPVVPPVPTPSVERES
jgi:hypothetical protein